MISRLPGIIIAALAAIGVGIFVTSTTQQDSMCQTDPPVVLVDYSSYQVNPCEVFSESYVEARSKFRDGAKKIGAELHSIVVKEHEEVDDYTMDIAILPGTADRLLIHTSGVHGVEGYAGSAIQLASFSHITAAATSGNRPTIVWLHAVNPFGMAHFRRANENNVDLNRNAFHDWSVPLGRDPNIASYDDFDEALFNPRRPPSLLDFHVAFWFRTIAAIAKHGLVTLKRAMVSGQYHNPKGIFYGGNRLEPSLQLIWDFFAKHDLTTNATTVTWIDVHTGLGKSGHDTLLLDPSCKFEASQIQAWFPDSELLLPTALDQHEVSQGYDLAIGMTTTFFARLFSHTSPLILAQEFGTIPSVLVARALVAENMAHNYLSTSQQQHEADDATIEWAKRTTRPAFYKRTTEWRRKILERGLRLFIQAMNREN